MRVHITYTTLILVAAGIGLLPAAARAQTQPDAAPAKVDANSGTVHLSAIPTRRAAERRGQQVGGKVVLYRTAWCGYCKRAAAYMTQQQIPFIERDIEADERNHAEYVRLGGKGSIPLIQFGDTMMMGFAQETFDQYYTAFQKKRGSKSAG